MTYDIHGRITKKELPEFTTTYGYYSNGLLKSETSTNGTSRTYEYDSYGRLYKDRDIGPDGKWLEKTYSYDAGNVETIQFTSQSGSIGTESYVYDYGNMKEVKFGTTSIWKLTEENAMGIAKTVLTGPITREYLYNSYGMPTNRKASSSSGGVFQNFSYVFDATKGNLSNRNDLRLGRTEGFTYDNLNRLKTYGVQTAEYDIKGNIKYKTDVGNTFSYDWPNKPYAISGVDAGTNTAIPSRNQSITYTSFERPATISENNNEAIFTYDGSGSRVKMQMKSNGSNTTARYYLGGRYELDLGTSVNKQKLYIGGDAYSAPAVIINQGSGNSWSFYYICRDYLGSMTHLVNISGIVESGNEYSYDAWGRLRNLSTHVAYTPGSEPALLLDRGYTGHEHLPQFGLINMNARLYDPAVGRFLSPDPFVQSPDFSQNFNRYSYALNNPLIFTDRDGEWNWIVAACGLVYGYVSHGLINNDWGWKALGNGLLSGVMWGVGYTSQVQSAGITPLSYAGQSALSSTVNSFMPSMNIPIGNNFSVSSSLGLGVGPSGLIAGVNVSGTYYKDDDFSITSGFGASKNMISWGGGFTVGDYGGSYYLTKYGNAPGPDGKSNAQLVGGVGLQFGDVSVRLENDVLAGNGDRWRSNAVEIGIGKFIFGTHLFNNDPEGSKSDIDYEGRNVVFDKLNKNGKGAWVDGQTYSSPFYVGYRSGNNVVRFGYSHRYVQDRTQNWVHRNGFFYLPFGHQNYYNKYKHMYEGAYRYSGYYNPYSLW